MSYKDQKYKVAIIGTIDSDYCYECGGNDVVVASITDWEELTWVEVEALRNGLNRLGNSALHYRVVFQPTEQKQLIIDSMAKGKKMAEAALKAAAKDAAAAKAKKEAREAKKKAKTEAARREEYERLKAEFEQNKK